MIKEQTFIVVNFSDLPDDIRDSLLEHYYDGIINGSYKRYWLTKDEPLYKMIVNEGFEKPDCVLIKFDW